MLDHHLFITDEARVSKQLTERGVEPKVLGKLREIISQRKSGIQEVEELRHRLNVASDDVKGLAQAGEQEKMTLKREELKALKGKLKICEERLTQIQESFDSLLERLPNLAADSVPVGPDGSANRIERSVGDIPTFNFEPKPHWELGEEAGVLDFEAARKMSGARFVMLKGWGARLERALASFMLDVARENGYSEVIPPVMVHPSAMHAVGLYPKFIGESFEVEQTNHVLIPTAEVPLLNLHQGDVFNAEKLPVRYCAFTPCFRKEAGAAGRDTRGLIRNHQFNKVELFSFVSAEESEQEHERLTGHAEEILKRLGLAYRVMTLSTGDMGFCASKTYDLEVWLPGQNAYREISSCSNCTDFQARRAQIRIREAPAQNGKKSKMQFVHTLNGSGLAVGRCWVAVVENYQQADGSIKVPEVLIPYLRTDVLR